MRNSIELISDIIRFAKKIILRIRHTLTSPLKINNGVDRNIAHNIKTRLGPKSLAILSAITLWGVFMGANPEKSQSSLE